MFLEKIKNAFDTYTAEQFIDAFFESVIISLIFSFFLWLRQFLLFKHKLIPINSSTISMNEVPATSYSLLTPTVGFDTEFSLRIQNIGSKTAEELRIIYRLDQTSNLSHGIRVLDRPLQHLFPGDIGDFTYKQVLNFENIQNVGSNSITIKTLLLCKKGTMTHFDISIFKNFSHNSVQSISILNIQSQNRFRSYLLRKLAKYNNKKTIKKLFNFIGLKDDFIIGYKLFLESSGGK